MEILIVTFTSLKVILYKKKVNVSNIKTTVSLASSVHNLKDGDDITLNVEPNLSTGIGTLTERVNVKRDTTTNKILIDPVEGLTTGIKLFNDATEQMKLH